ncbi:MAG TPA: ABC-type transport auxiliary lipoprotein family protein [Dokdonella sp.]
MIRRLPFVFVLPLALCACSSLFNVQRTPFTIYSPQYAAARAEGAPVDWQLVVETPLASDTLATPRILVMPSPGVIEVFPGARWSDTAPSLLRDLVVRGFEASGRIVGVGSAVSGLRADYSLAIDLHDFQIEIVEGAPRAALRFQARLLDYTSNRVLAARTFTAEEPAAGTEAALAFAAFQRALNTSVARLVDWTLATGTAARAAATAADSPPAAQRRQ